MNKPSEDKTDQVINSVRYIDNTVNTIVAKITTNLDKIVDQAKSDLENDKMTTSKIERVIMEIPVQVYYIQTELEKIILRETIAKEYSRERFNKEMGLAEGTVAVKTSIAEQKSQEERVIENMYKTAKGRIEGKIENANNLLNSCKKIMSLRISEREM